MPKKKVTHTKETQEESVFTLSESTATVALSPSNKKRSRWIMGITLTAIVIVGTGLNVYWHYQKNQALKNNPVAQSEMEQEKIVANVGKLMELPANQQPTLAQVTDITKLKGQSFFQDAKNGDIVIIYPKANEAILYDPTVNKILKSGPISLSSQISSQAPMKGTVAGASTQASSSSTPTIGAPVTVALYNGTTIEGLTRKIQSQLVTQMPNATVVQNANANKQNYNKTLVVDLSNNNPSSAQQLAKLLNGTVGKFPPNETVPVNADIVVILGR